MMKDGMPTKVTPKAVTSPKASALASGFNGWAQIRNGNITDGLALMRASMPDWQGFWGAWCFPLDAAFAAALADQGECNEAYSIVQVAADVGGSTGGHWWDAEFLRVRGNIMLKRSPSDKDQARASFTEALSAARKREARLFELRAASDLASLCLEEGHADAALDLLEPVVQGITEGYGLPDFVHAQTTLDRSLEQIRGRSG